jgi:hypothetical protein
MTPHPSPSAANVAVTLCASEGEISPLREGERFRVLRKRRAFGCRVVAGQGFVAQTKKNKVESKDTIRTTMKSWLYQYPGQISYVLDYRMWLLGSY